MTELTTKARSTNTTLSKCEPAQPEVILKLGVWGEGEGEGGGSV